MSSKITGKEYPHQRPYAWTTEETGTLFDDLYEFYRTEASDDYFLGTIVLIKEDKSYADIIDGQQRLTTLIILFSVLESKLTGDAREACNALLQEKGNILAGISTKPQLHLCQRDQEFFNQYIQKVKISSLLSFDKATLMTEAQQHIQENCKELVDQLDKDFKENQEELIKFSTFLLNRCFIVAVSTDSQNSAFRISSVLGCTSLCKRRNIESKTG